MNPYLALAIAIVGEVVGTSALKASHGFSKLGPSLIVVVAYAAAFWFFSLVVNTVPVGIAYAIWSGGGIVLVALVAWVVYGQRPDAAGIIGMGLIIVGVVVLNVFSKANGH